MEDNTFIQFIAEYWQLVFLYLFKYFKDINEKLNKLEHEVEKRLSEHDFEIKMIKYTQQFKGPHHVHNTPKE